VCLNNKPDNGGFWSGVALLISISLTDVGGIYNWVVVLEWFFADFCRV
jgi:hypothetical protein